jgi:hypothetical protein
VDPGSSQAKRSPVPGTTTVLPCIMRPNGRALLYCFCRAACMCQVDSIQSYLSAQYSTCTSPVCTPLRRPAYTSILLSLIKDVRQSANADDAFDVVTMHQFAVRPSTSQAYIVRAAIDPVAAVFLSDIMSLKTDKHVYTQSREFGTDCVHTVIGWFSATTARRAPSSTKIGQDMPASRHAEGSAKVHTMCRNVLNPGLVRYRTVLRLVLEMTPADLTWYISQTLTAYEHELVLRDRITRYSAHVVTDGCWRVHTCCL